MKQEATLPGDSEKGKVARRGEYERLKERERTRESQHCHQH